jgi:dolichyl-phosphate-mannose--protein O-mannosyl transferase
MSIYNDLFGPLDSDYCNIFFFFMVLAFVYFLISMVGLFIVILSKNQKKDGKTIGLILTNAIMMLIVYFTHRTLYSMCISSLR